MKFDLEVDPFLGEIIERILSASARQLRVFHGLAATARVSGVGSLRCS